MNIRYHQEEEVGVWTSPDSFEVETVADVIRGVVAGWLMGRARWATLAESGEFLFGIDRKGNRHLTQASWLKGAV